MLDIFACDRWSYCYCDLLLGMTEQLECSQCPLVEIWFTSSLYISYLFQAMTARQECSQCSLVEMESTTSVPILFISSYNSTTGVFRVPPGGDGVYYFSVYVLVDQLFNGA